MCRVWLSIHSPQYSSRRRSASAPSTVTPQASSIAPAGRHLVGDRADPADARGDVGWLGVAAPAQQRLEEAGRFVDVEADVGDHAALHTYPHRAFALDPGQRAHPQRPVLTVGHDLTLMETSWNADTLNVANTRLTASSSMPSARSWAVSAGTL